MEEKNNAPVQEAPAAEQIKKEKMPKKRVLRVVVCLCVIAMIVLITNPTMIPFLPEETAKGLSAIMQDLFGDVGKLQDMVSFSWVSVFQLIIMVALLLVIREIANAILERIHPSTNRGMTMKDLFSSALKYILTLVGFFWGLAIIGVNVSTLFASVGIMALIIGFGAESLIADVITGLFMIFENQYNVGDIIEMDGYRGTVVNIAIRTTSIQDNDGNIKIFNNSDMRNIINQSSDSSYSVCDVRIPYEADIENAEQVIDKLCKELLEEHPDVFLTQPVYQGVQELQKADVMLRIVAEVKEQDRFDAARMMNRKMKIGLEKSGITASNKKSV